MKIVPTFFLEMFPGINVHPSDLTITDNTGKPKYVGMNAIKDAVDNGEKYIASTAHVIATDVDCGKPMVVSRKFSLEGRNRQDLTTLHEQLKISCEHILYPRLLEMLSRGLLSAAEMPYQWESFTQKCKSNNGTYFSKKMTELSETFSPLDLAYLAQDYSSEVGFDFSNIDQVFHKVQEEFEELTYAFSNRQQDFDHFIEEIGDCFFALVNLCRFIPLHPNTVLHRTNKKYLKRCDYIETQLKNNNNDWSHISADQLLTMWKKAKENEIS